MLLIGHCLIALVFYWFFLQTFYTISLSSIVSTFDYRTHMGRVELWVVVVLFWVGSGHKVVTRIQSISGSNRGRQSSIWDDRNILKFGGRIVRVETW